MVPGWTTDSVFDFINGGFSISKSASTIDIVGVSLETGEKRIIIENAFNPSISYDGRYLCYEDLTENVITVFDFETEESWPVTESVKAFSGPSISADNSRIIFDIWDRERIYIKDDMAVANYQASVELTEPANFAILGNYPNPFNPATTIEFSLPEAGFVGLVIYNVMGQKVRELLTGSMTPGIHTVTWYGRDDRGLPVSAGVYVTRLRMNETEVSGRMTLVK